MRRTTPIHRNRARAAWTLVLVVAVTGWLAAAPSAAQGPPVPWDDDLGVRGGGWELLRNPAELLTFGLDLLTAIVLAALLVFHPVEVRRWRTVRDFDRPKLMFLLALVGLAIGFLVIHHGYVIGFILFGLGGLLRFKMEVGDAVDTTRAIIVVLIGLCAGLSLPVMAAAITVAAWTTIHVFSRSNHYRVEVKFKKGELSSDLLDDLRREIVEKGWKCPSATRSLAKSTVEVVLSVPRELTRGDVTREIEASLAQRDAAIKEWHLS